MSVEAPKDRGSDPRRQVIFRKGDLEGELELARRGDEAARHQNLRDVVFATLYDSGKDEDERTADVLAEEDDNRGLIGARFAAGNNLGTFEYVTDRLGKMSVGADEFARVARAQGYKKQLESGIGAPIEEAPKPAPKPLEGGSGRTKGSKGLDTPPPLR